MNANTFPDSIFCFLQTRPEILRSDQKDEKRKRLHPKTRSEATKILRLIRRSVHTKTALANIGSQEETPDPFKILISTILSARTRDPVTEEAASRLFSTFPDPKSLASASLKEVTQAIKSVLYYNVKARRIIEVSRILNEKYNGVVPDSMHELLGLPGVGRKTANCVLVYAFKRPAIPVDTHVHRISNRIGLVDSKTPEGTEKLLSNLYAEKYWLSVNELLVSFGQTICKPIVPRCKVCAVRPMCNYYKNKVRTGESPSSD